MRIEPLKDRAGRLCEIKAFSHATLTNNPEFVPTVSGMRATTMRRIVNRVFHKGDASAIAHLGRQELANLMAHALQEGKLSMEDINGNK